MALFSSYFEGILFYEFLIYCVKHGRCNVTNVSYAHLDLKEVDTISYQWTRLQDMPILSTTYLFSKVM